MKLFLTGYSGCGKSSLGRRLARRLGVRFVDTDAEIERREGASTSEIFKYAGETYFRRAERAVMDEIFASDEDSVVSTGGGLPVWEDNMERLNGAGTTVYIRRNAAQIASRLTPYGREKRPRLQGLGDRELVEFMARDIAEREPVYAKARYVLDGASAGDRDLIDRLVTIFREGR